MTNTLLTSTGPQILIQSFDGIRTFQHFISCLFEGFKYWLTLSKIWTQIKAISFIIFVSIPEVDQSLQFIIFLSEFKICTFRHSMLPQLLLVLKYCTKLLFKSHGPLSKIKHCQSFAAECEMFTGELRFISDATTAPIIAMSQVHKQCLSSFSNGTPCGCGKLSNYTLSDWHYDSMSFFAAVFTRWNFRKINSRSHSDLSVVESPAEQDEDHLARYSL